MIAPKTCRTCTAETGRHIGCHIECTHYAAYRARIDEANRRKALDRMVESTIIESKRTHMRRVSHCKPIEVRR